MILILVESIFKIGTVLFNMNLLPSSKELFSSERINVSFS